MATTHLTRTTSGTPTLGTKCTFSTWIKFSEAPTGNASDRWLFGEHDNSSNHSYLYLRNSSAIGWFETSSGTILSKITTRLFRDINAWYHIQVIMDTTDSTAEDRWKLYVNGERITSWSTNSPSAYNSNHNIRVNRTGKNIYIGGVPSYQTHFNGLMSHTHFCDGTALAPTVFGSTDSTTGEWKINTSPTFTAGNNGFTILKDGNTITDQSSNSNNFTVGAGTLTKSEDNPSNVFATLNPLWTQESTRVPTLTYGNTMFSGGSSSTWYQTIGTLGFSSGKYYWEAKYNAGTNLGKNLVGAVGIDGMSSGKFYEKTPSVFYKNEDGGETRVNNSQSSGNYGTIAQNEILGCAIDMDASTPTATFYKNGSPLVSNVSLTGFAGKTIVPAVSTYSSGEFQMNFGNGYFGTTAVSSAGSNASGNGIFEYDCPTGYTALSTKGLNL